MYRDDNNRGGQGNFPPRQMFQGNWTCGSCGAEIKELPFEPDPSRESTLKCRDCHKKAMADRGGNRGGYRRF